MTLSQRLFIIICFKGLVLQLLSTNYLGQMIIIDTEKDNKGIFADRSVPEVVEELYKSSNIAHVRVAKLLKEKYL